MRALSRAALLLLLSLTAGLAAGAGSSSTLASAAPFPHAAKHLKDFVEANGGLSLHDWQPGQVRDFLLSIHFPASATKAFFEAGVDGPVFLELDSDTLSKIGVNAVESLKYRKLSDTLKSSYNDEALAHRDLREVRALNRALFYQILGCAAIHPLAAVALLHSNQTAFDKAVLRISDSASSPFTQTRAFIAPALILWEYLSHFVDTNPVSSYTFGFVLLLQQAYHSLVLLGAAVKLLKEKDVAETSRILGRFLIINTLLVIGLSFLFRHLIFPWIPRALLDAGFYAFVAVSPLIPISWFHAVISRVGGGGMAKPGAGGRFSSLLRAIASAFSGALSRIYSLAGGLNNLAAGSSASGNHHNPLAKRRGSGVFASGNALSGGGPQQSAGHRSSGSSSSSSSSSSSPATSARDQDPSASASYRKRSRSGGSVYSAASERRPSSRLSSASSKARLRKESEHSSSAKRRRRRRNSRRNARGDESDDDDGGSSSGPDDYNARDSDSEGFEGSNSGSDSASFSEDEDDEEDAEAGGLPPPHAGNGRGSRDRFSITAINTSLNRGLSTGSLGGVSSQPPLSAMSGTTATTGRFTTGGTGSSPSLSTIVTPDAASASATSARSFSGVMWPVPDSSSNTTVVAAAAKPLESVHIAPPLSTPRKRLTGGGAAAGEKTGFSTAGGGGGAGGRSSAVKTNAS